MFLNKKLPRIEQFAPVYAIIVLFTYTWSIIQFFWRVPSWLYFSSMGEIFVTLAYLMIVNLVESLLVLFLVSLILFVLPTSWGYDQFIVKGSLLVVTVLGFLAYRNYSVSPSKVLHELPSTQWAIWLSVQAIVLLAPFKRFPAFCKIIEAIADRFVVFLYVAVPVSLISLVVILYRNLF